MGALLVPTVATLKSPSCSTLLAFPFTEGQRPGRRKHVVFLVEGMFPYQKKRERESECCQLWIDQPPQGEQVLRWEVLETTLPLYLGDDLMMYV